MREHQFTAPTAIRMTTGGRSAVAVLIGLGAAATVVGLRVANAGVEPVDQNWWLVAWLTVGTADAAVGAALLPRFGHRRLAGCLLVVGLAGLVVAVAAQAAGYAAAIEDAGAWNAVGGAADWARPLATGVLTALVPWELVAGRRRRNVELVWWTTAGLILLVAVRDAADVPGLAVVDWLVAASATAATGRLLIAWRRPETPDDPLPAWLAAGAVIAWLAVVPPSVGVNGFPPGGGVSGALLLISTLPLLTAGAAVSAMRERPGRFHGVAHDVIGWFILWSGIVLLYTVVVAGLGHFVGGSGSTWLLVATTGAIAVSLEPARQRVRRAVDRLVFGARDDPLEVVRGVVDHVGAASGDDLLPALVESLHRELRVDAIAIEVRTPAGWSRPAALGPPTRHERVIELEQQGEVVGRLVVGWESGPSMRTRDERVLAELAGPLGLAVGWVRLAADLRRSSVAIVSARAEERRRLRRDLHDGLGPGLTGVSLGLRTAVRQLERSTDAASVEPARRLLARAADEVDALVGEVKRIVRDLRPTALDQFGLVDAVAEFVRAFDGELEIDVSMPAGPVELPAAVEVAAYRVVTEAVTNVVRHAHAARCWLTISAGAVVEVDVVDDGIGVGDGVADGVGWTAMRERAAELGGSVQVSPHHPHGTHVRVRLPAVLP